MIKPKTITAVAILALSYQMTTPQIEAETVSSKVIATYEGMSKTNMAIDTYGNTLLVAMKRDDISQKMTFNIVDPESLKLVKEFTVDAIYFEEGGDVKCEMDYLRAFQDNSPGRLYLSQTLFNTDDKWEVAFNIIGGSRIVNEDGEIMGDIMAIDADGYSTFNYYVSRFNNDGEWRPWIAGEHHSEDKGTRFFSFTESNPGSNVQRVELQKAVGFPNPVPAGSDFTISMTSEVPEGTTLTVATIDGAVVYSAELEAGETKAVVPASILSRGSYVYSVISSDDVLASGKILAE